MINIAQPIIEAEEIKAVNDVLQSGILAQGPKVAELERLFADYCGTKFAVAVNSGTAALHSALYAAGVRAGDEVITTPFSFIATINPILMQGATPVLVDIDPATFNINPELIEKAITDKTKAIIPVHLYGQPCDFAEIKSIADKKGIKVIEDACQAVGAEYANQQTGGLGDLGCFSLYATKNIMCGEGGVVTTNDEAFAVALKQFRQHGMTGPYEYAELGYNYRMTDLQAAIAVEQLKKATTFNTARQRTAEILRAGLEGVNKVELPKIASNRTHVYHQFTIRLVGTNKEQRDAFQAHLKESGVGSGVYYPKALHEYKHIAALGYKMGDFPEAEKAASEVISLPVHPGVSELDAQTIISSVRQAIKDVYGQ